MINTILVLQLHTVNQIPLYSPLSLIYSVSKPKLIYHKCNKSSHTPNKFPIQCCHQFFKDTNCLYLQNRMQSHLKDASTETCLNQASHLFNLFHLYSQIWSRLLCLFKWNIHNKRRPLPWFKRYNYLFIYFNYVNTALVLNWYIWGENRHFSPVSHQKDH